MKKNSFMEGAMIATIGLVITKAIGLIYVIPFYALIGKSGGVLYSYAYSVYVLFLNLSTSGIPLAISKIVSEYNTLGYHNTKERVYKIGYKLLTILGVFFFLILLFFGKEVAYLIIGNTKGGWSLNDVAFVIRVISTALLIVPILSVLKGYFQGHKVMTPSSIANIIEQILRVSVILIGGFISLKVFHLSVKTTVAISVFAATIGALGSYLYLKYKHHLNKEDFKVNAEITREEYKITNVDLTKKLLKYAIPFVIIELLRSAYTMVDVVTVVRTMTNLNYNIDVAETVFSMVTTWGTKINTIVIALASGIGVSLIPNIAGSYIKKDMKDVAKKINQSLLLMLFVAIPLTIGMSFLGESVWVIFYGHDKISIELFKVFIFQALTFSIYSILIDVIQAIGKSKISLGTLILSFIIKASLNIPLMTLFLKFNVNAGIGTIVASFIAHLIPIVLIITYLIKIKKINLKPTMTNLINIVLCSLIMLIGLKILSLFISTSAATRPIAIFKILLFGGVGIGIYLVTTYISSTLNKVVGKETIEKLLIKLKLKRRM